MNGVLLDTDVFSYFVKRDTRAALYAPDVAGAQLCVSFQTVAELRAWAISRNWGTPRRQSLETAMMRCVVLSNDDDMSRHWAAITAHRRSKGFPIECGDAWIAATAIRHSMSLLTHNSRDFADIPNLTLVTHAP